MKRLLTVDHLAPYLVIEGQIDRTLIAFGKTAFQGSEAPGKSEREGSWRLPLPAQI